MGFAVLSAIVISSNSCAPTAPPEPNTPVTLNAAPSSLALARTSPSQNASLGLSCGCSFRLSVAGYGGDTALIHFSIGEFPDSSTHNVSAFVNPASLPAGSGKDSAWIALTTPHDSISPSNAGTPLYDTLRVLLTY